MNYLQWYVHWKRLGILIGMTTFTDNRHLDDHLVDQWLELARRVMDHA
jgi:phage terminase large subunit